MTNAIVPWMGGKRRLAKDILPVLDSIEHTCYLEAFAGGAAIFFAKEPKKVEAINDIDGELINLYRCVKAHLRELITQFEWLLVAREQFDVFMKTPPEVLTDIQRAARFFYLQKMAFGARTTRRHFGTATTTKPGINILRLEETLSQAWQRLAQVYIENLPWLDVAQKYDAAHTLIYCDPPYWETAGYGVAFTFCEYQKMTSLADTMKGTMLISINDHVDIRNVFAGLYAKELKTTYSVSVKKAKESGELLISNKPLDGFKQLSKVEGKQAQLILQ